MGGDDKEGTHYYVCSKCNKPCDIIQKLKKNKKLIPLGYYCYAIDKNTRVQKLCPYWNSDVNHRESQEYGYCCYLEKGDWDLNEEKTTITKSKRQEDGTYKETVYENTSWHDLGLAESLLWDQVKSGKCPKYK